MIRLPSQSLFRTHGRTWGITMAIISSATFGFIPLFSLGPLRAGMPLSSVLFYRFAIATVIFGAFTLARRISLRITLRQFAELLLLAVLCYSGSAAFLLLSYTYIPSGIATTINFLYPIMVALLMRLIFGERVRMPTIIAIGVSIAGVALLSWDPCAVLDWRGVASALATVLCYGFYLVGLNKLSVRRLPGAVATFYIMLLSASVFLAASLAQDGLYAIPSIAVGSDLLLLAVVATLISNLTLVLAIHAIGSTFTALLGSMEPVVAVGVGVLLLGETISATQAMGVLLVIASVMLVVLARRNG